jgi:hypothetical protein
MHERGARHNKTSIRLCWRASTRCWRHITSTASLGAPERVPADVVAPTRPTPPGHAHPGRQRGGIGLSVPLMDAKAPEEWTSLVRESARMRLRVDESITLSSRPARTSTGPCRYCGPVPGQGVDPCRRPSVITARPCCCPGDDAVPCREFVTQEQNPSGDASSPCPGRPASARHRRSPPRQGRPVVADDPGVVAVRLLEGICRADV